MVNCENCGYPLPQEGSFCPNCGTITKERTGSSLSSARTMVSFLKIGILGALLSIMISLLTPGVELYFLPPFISSLLVIFLSRTKKIENALLITMIVYFLTIMVVNVLNLVSLSIDHQSYANYLANHPEDLNSRVPTLFDILIFIVYPISAFIAAYLGSRFTPAAREEPSPSRYRREEAGPGGVVYSVKDGSQMRLVLSRLIMFKYPLTRSSIAISRDK